MSYVQEVIEKTVAKNPDQPEFLQTVREILGSLEAAVDANEEKYRKNALLERLVEPDRQVAFRVVWTDDKGQAQVNRGYRVQFNNAIGPYKGGLRFHPSVNLSIMKFLGLEQTFKNSLTGLPMGGAKGGADFDPRGRSDGEVMRFCQSFMTELYRHIGPDMDVPAGDIGVGGREIGYLYGMYKKIRGSFTGAALTGKGFSYGGSRIRPEATGFGAVYFLQEVLKRKSQQLAGKTFALSGFGNVSWGACSKLVELGGKVLTISGPDGYVFVQDGLTKEMVDYMLVMRASGHDRVGDMADKFPGKVVYHPGEKPWGVKVDVCMPCATQNEIRLADAEKIIAAGCPILNEVANMPTAADATELLLKKGVVIAPSKAVNAGGVATSGLEITQNLSRLSWSAAEVDQHLHEIMKNIHDNVVNASIKYLGHEDLIAGANLAAFEKVADAMISQGTI